MKPASTSITATYNGGTPGSVSLYCIEYSGIALTSPLIGVSAVNLQSSPGTGTNAVTSNALNVSTGVPALVLGLISDQSGLGMSAGTGYTLRFDNGGTGGDALLGEDLRATVTGNQTATGTTTHGTDTFVSYVIAFGESAVGAVLAGGGTSSSSASGALIGSKHVVEDLIMETTTTTGTGSVSLAGAVNGYKTFASVMEDTDTCLYSMIGITSGIPNGSYEIGIGTYGLSGNVLARTQVLRSSNANAAVVLSGTYYVAITEPSAALGNKGVYNAGNSGASITIDWANGPFQMVTLTAATPAISFANSMICPHGVLDIYQDATGGRVPTLNGVTFPAGGPPVWAAAANGHNIVDIVYNSRSTARRTATTVSEAARCTTSNRSTRWPRSTCRCQPGTRSTACTF